MKIDIEAFASNMGLDPKDIRGLYTTFFTEMHDNINLLKEALKEDNYSDLEDIMHNIKGVCLNLELKELGKYSERVYTEIKASNYSNLDDFIDYFESEIKIISELVFDYYKG